MTEPLPRAQAPAISFAETFVSSEAFLSLFREGMGLVEATAAYLDGPGRDESKALSRALALGYASESMRLTSRLMQIASWLLLHRAVKEGELSSGQVAEQRAKVRLVDQDQATAPETFDGLPERLRALVAQSMRLQARILHLDGLIGETEPAPRHNAVALQRSLLESAFEPRRR